MMKRPFLGLRIQFLELILVFFILQPLVECGNQFTFNSARLNWDNCQIISKKNVISYREALDCYQSFPFNETIRSTTLDTLRKTLPFYAFIDISKKSPEPKIPSHEDIYLQLDKIGDKHYDTEMEFQRDTMELFRRLNDGHTGYHSDCFTTFIFRQPFPIITVRSEINGQKFLVLEHVELPFKLEPEWRKLGLNISRYLGAEVLLIDAISPVEYLENYANKYVGASRDINSRFNLALARVLQRDGKWGISNGNFASTTAIPSKQEITYTFRLSNGEGIETVTVPYLVSNPRNFKNKDEFYNNYCSLNSDYRIKLKGKAKHLHIPQIPEVAKTKIDGPLPQLHSFDQDPLRNPLTKGKVVQTWIVNNNTGVMTITTFSGRSEAQFLDEAARGFRALHSKGVTTMILDLSNNGGGVICWGYYIYDYLFPPKPSESAHRFNTDMHESALLEELVKKDHREEGFYNFQYWDAPNGGHFNSTKDFILDHAYRRGGTVGHYTSQFQDHCGVSPLRTSEYMSQQELSNVDPPWPASQVVVVTNSICYSTCTLLTNSLQEVQAITTYALGGIRGREATAASIQGGTVYNLDALEEDLEELGLTDHPEAPKNFITKSSFSFTIREAYSIYDFSTQKKKKKKKKSKKFGPRPLEFTWEPATYHVPYAGPVTFLSPYQQWRQIADDFSRQQ